MWKNRDQRPRTIIKEFNSLQRDSYASSRVVDFPSMSGSSLNSHAQTQQASFGNISLFKEEELSEEEVESHQSSIEKSGEVAKMTRREKLEKQGKLLRELEREYEHDKQQDRINKKRNSQRRVENSDFIGDDKLLEMHYQNYMSQIRSENNMRESKKVPLSSELFSPEDQIWKEEHELMLFLIFQLKLFNRSTIESMLPYSEQQASEYLEEHFQRLLSNFVLAQTLIECRMARYDKEPYLIYLEINVKLKLLIGYFLKSFEKTNPKDEDKGETVEASESEEEVSDLKISSRPILPAFRWRQLPPDR